MKAQIFGTVAVKFRAFGIDFGYAKREIPQGELVIDFPVPFPPQSIRFERFGIKLDLVFGPV